MKDEKVYKSVICEQKESIRIDLIMLKQVAFVIN